MEQYRVALSEEEREGLTRMVSVGKAAARKLTHARILLLADVALPPNSLRGLDEALQLRLRRGAASNAVFTQPAR